MSDVIQTIAQEIADCLAQVSPAEVGAAVELLNSAPRVFVSGAGRSALGIRGFGMRLMHLGVTTHVVGETTTPGIASGDLLVIGSGSGRTASLLSSAQKAKSLGAKVLLVTIDPASPIGELADATIRIPAPSPKASGGGAQQVTIQPMGSLFEQSLFLLLDGLIVMLMQKRGIGSDEMFTRHANME